MDIPALRRDIPALATNWPGKNRPLIHFNNAGASLMPRIVEETVTKYIQHENRVGSYEAQREHSKQLSNVYDLVGKLIGCKNPQVEIAVQESATVAWCNAFYSIPLQRGDVVLTVASDYGANFVAMLQQQKRLGFEIKVIPNDEKWQHTSPAALAQMLKDDDDRIRCVALTHIPTNCGLVNPLEEIAAVIHEHNRKLKQKQHRRRVLFLVDACQTAGQMPIDVEANHIDLLSATSRKFLRGPRGCGFLFVRESLLTDGSDPSLFGEPPTIDHSAAPWKATLTEYQLRRDARRYEKWEYSPANRLGMGAAIEYALNIGLDRIWLRVQQVASYLRDSLAKELGSRVLLCDIGKTQCGIVSFRLLGNDALRDCNAVMQHMRSHGVNITVSTAAVTRLDMDRRPQKFDAFLRASVHYFNTEEEVDEVVRLLKQLVVARSAKL